MAKKLSRNFYISIREICNTLKISRGTYYRFFADSRVAFCWCALSVTIDLGSQ